jgi:cbb3-type cytochrome oxidase subunit 3
VGIPAAGNWGMVILALAFLGAIAWMVRARRSLR